MMSKKISRRTALKLIGTAAASAALGSISLLSACQKKSPADSSDLSDNTTPQTSDTQSSPEPINKTNNQPSEKSKRIVFYFTGTGNSLYVARQISDNIVSIPQAIKHNQLSYQAEEIGFVYPVYGMMPPNRVRQFIQKASLKADYFFAIPTYGNNQGNAVGVWDEISKSAGHPFDYIATLLMVDNWLPMFDMNEQRQIDKKTDENLAKIKAQIDSHEKYHEPIPEGAAEKWNQRGNTGPFQKDGIHANAEEWFTITDKCISCGLCTRVCPRKNYTLPGEKSECKGECELCFACIQNCPHKAIIITSGEKNSNARYRHPAVAIKDIQNANNQN